MEVTTEVDGEADAADDVVLVISDDGGDKGRCTLCDMLGVESTVFDLYVVEVELDANVLGGGSGDRVPEESDEREVVVEEVELAIEETGVVSVMEDVVVVEVEEVVDGGGGVREIDGTTECDCELAE